MSASVLRSPGFIRIASEATILPEATTRSKSGWNPEEFASKQIRGLVRQLFFSNAQRPVRQVVFSAVEPDAEVGSLCRQAGETLALETHGNVAVVTQKPELLDPDTVGAHSEFPSRERDSRLGGLRVQSNLWLFSEDEVVVTDKHLARRTSLHSHLGDLRKEFEYSIIEGPATGESSEATALGQLADGMVLVLSAQNTRRATARKVKETLDSADVQILGTVLSDRTFPIPYAVYRRL